MLVYVNIRLYERQPKVDTVPAVDLRSRGTSDGVHYVPAGTVRYHRSAVAWGILSGVSWYIDRSLVALGWFLFLLIVVGFPIVQNWVSGTPALIVLFGCLVGAFGLVIADAYYNDRHEGYAAV